MQEFLLNFDNKEIFIEILHHAVDCLIGNCNEEQTVRLSHKYGFQSANDLIATTKTIAQCFRNHCTEGTEADIRSQFTNLLNSELQPIVVSVWEARRKEICEYVRRYYNSQDQKLLEYFHWDLRIIPECINGSSISLSQPIVNLSLNCINTEKEKSELLMQLNPQGLKNLIAELEKAVVT